MDGREWSIWEVLDNFQMEITFVPYRLKIEELSYVGIVRIVWVSFGEGRKKNTVSKTYRKYQKR